MYWSKQIILDELIKQGDIALDRGRVISSIDLVKYPGDYPVYSSSAKKNGYFGSYNKFDFDEELITWSVDGGGYFFHRPKHKFSVTNVSGILHILNKEKFDYKFLFYVLDYQHKNQIFDYVDKAHPSIIRKRYFIPEICIVEQQKISKIVSKLDVAIKTTEQLIAKYSRIKIGLMQDLLTNGIDENGVIRNEKTHEFIDSPLGRIPKEWKCEKLGNLILAIDPQPDHRTPPTKIDGVAYVGISDFLPNGEIDEKNCRKVGLNVLSKQQKSFTVEEGDLIFGKIGTIGKPKVLPAFTKLNFTLSANVILIKPYESPDFIYWTMISNYIDEQVKLAIHSTSQPAFGMQKIRNLNVITPSPKERDRISNILNKMRNNISEEYIKLRKFQALKTGLMQDILSGKVRVSNLLKENV